MNLIIGEPEAVLQPVEERRLEDVAGAVEGVAGQPDQLRTQEVQAAHMLHLFLQGGGGDAVGQAHL